MPANKRIALALSALALTAAGCTTSATGQPTPEPGGTSSGEQPPSSGSSDPAKPTVEIPPRPRDLSLDGLDPCTLYTDAQRAQLKVDDVKSGESGSEQFKGMKECSLENQTEEPFFQYSALAVTTEGVEAWLTGDRNVDAELTSVQGYPAARFTFRGVQDEGCDIAIGVADKQYLKVTLVPTDKGPTQDQLCQLAGTAADMAMTTLQTLK